MSGETYNPRSGSQYTQDGRIVDTAEVFDRKRRTFSPIDENLVAQRIPIIQLNGCFEISELRDDFDTLNTATITSTESEFNLTHNAAGDAAKFVTGSRGVYQPGNAGEAGVAVRLNGILSGDSQAEWGYMDFQDANPYTVNDGAVFGKDANGRYIAVYRNGTQQTKVYKENWNLEQPEIDLSNVTIFQVRFTYYGGGLIEFRIRKGKTGDAVQRFETVHTFKPTGQTTFGNSNLKVGGYLKSSDYSGVIDLFISGRQFAILGMPQARRRIISHSVSGVTVPTTGFVPIMSFKRKSDRKSLTVALDSFEISTDNDIELRLKANTTLTGASYITPAGHQASEVEIEVDESATSFSNGIELNKYFAAGGGSSDKFEFTSGDIETDLPDGYNVSLVAKADTTDATVRVIGRMAEIR